MRRFRNKRYESESVRSHLESLTDIREQPTAIGKAVSDKDYIDIFLFTTAPSCPSVRARA